MTAPAMPTELPHDPWALAGFAIAGLFGLLYAAQAAGGLKIFQFHRRNAKTLTSDTAEIKHDVDELKASTAKLEAGQEALRLGQESTNTAIGYLTTQSSHMLRMLEQMTRTQADDRARIYLRESNNGQ